MKRNKVEEVQNYLRGHDINVSETTIVNAAIDIARRTSGMEDWVFVREFEKDMKKED